MMSVNISAQTVGGINAETVNIYNGGSNSDFKILGGELKKYTGSAIKVTIPDNVVKIGEKAFAGMEQIKSVFIPDSVEIIGEGAFSECTGLTSVRISNSVKSLNGIFYKCTGLKTVNIPDSVTELSGTFSNCTGLTSITIPNSVTNIGAYTFFSCTSLETVVLSDSLKTIGIADNNMNGTFSNCINLRKISFPRSLKVIGSGAFSYSGLTEVNIPANVEIIGHKAFLSCENLVSATISNPNVKMGYGILWHCSNLTNVSAPGISDCFLRETPVWEGKCQRCGGKLSLFGCKYNKTYNTENCRTFQYLFKDYCTFL